MNLGRFINVLRPTVTGRGLPPVLRRTVPPRLLTFWSSQTSLRTAPATFDLEPKEFCFTISTWFSFLVVLLHLWGLPRPMKDKQNVHCFTTDGLALPFFSPLWGQVINSERSFVVSWCKAARPRRHVVHWQHSESPDLENKLKRKHYSKPNRKF